MRHGVAAVTVGVVLLGVSGCAGLDGDLDQPAQTACDDLASYMEDEAEDGRESTLRGIADQAKESEHEDIAHGGKSLANLASEPGWESGADVLAAACLDHGWELGGCEMEVFWAAVAAIVAIIALGATIVFAVLQNKHSSRQSKAADAQVEFARKQLDVAHRVWEDSVQPYVFANVGMSRSNPQLLVVSLENTGSTAATDIKVECEPKILNFYNQNDVSSWQMSTLGPGAHFERVVAVAHMYFEDKDTPRRVRVSITGNGPSGALDIDPYEVDIDELGQMLAAEPWTLRTANSLKAIARDVEVIKEKLSE